MAKTVEDAEIKGSETSVEFTVKVSVKDKELYAEFKGIDPEIAWDLLSAVKARKELESQYNDSRTKLAEAVEMLIKGR